MNLVYGEELTLLNLFHIVLLIPVKTEELVLKMTRELMMLSCMELEESMMQLGVTVQLPLEVMDTIGENIVNTHLLVIPTLVFIVEFVLKSLTLTTLVIVLIPFHHGPLLLHTLDQDVKPLEPSLVTTTHV